MKTILLLSFSLLTIFLSSCSSTPASRIDKNPELYGKLSKKHQELVRQGRIERGMTKPAVYIALGHPDTKLTGQKYGKAEERWDYNVYIPVYSHGFSPFYGYGGGCYGRRGYYGAYFQPTVHYVPRLGSSVLFKSDKVIGWNQVQRNY